MNPGKQLRTTLEGTYLRAGRISRAHDTLVRISLEQLEENPDIRKLANKPGWFFLRRNDPRIIAEGGSQLVISLEDTKAVQKTPLCAKIEKRTDFYGKEDRYAGLLEDYFVLGATPQSNVFETASVLRQLRNELKLNFIVPFIVPTNVSSWYSNTVPGQITVDLRLNDTYEVNEAYEADFEQYTNGEQLQQDLAEIVGDLQNIENVFPHLLSERCRHRRPTPERPFEQTFMIVNGADDHGYLVAGDLNNIRFKHLAVQQAQDASRASVLGPRGS